MANTFGFAHQFDALSLAAARRQLHDRCGSTVVSIRMSSDPAATVLGMAVDRPAQRVSAHRADAASFESADYELRWPPKLAARELNALRVGANVRERHEQIEFLLEEVFLGEAPARGFAAVAARTQTANDTWGAAIPTSVEGEDADGYLDRLLAYLPQLREYQEPAPYWPIRHGRSQSGSPKTIEVQFAAMINDLYLHGVSRPTSAATMWTPTGSRSSTGPKSLLRASGHRTFGR